MKSVFRILLILLLVSEITIAQADTEERKLSSFTEISMRVPGKLYLTQGNVQKVEINAKSATLNEIITEINGRQLVIRFATRNLLSRTFDPGKIEIYVTIPEVSGLSLSGSGDIIAEGEIKALIVDFSLSGSGNLILNHLNCDRIKSAISGSGNIILSGDKKASEFNGVISGSGNIKAGDLEAENVNVTISGSGNCTIRSNGNIKVKIVGSGNLYYSGNPDIDSTIVGSGGVKKN